MLLLHMLSEAPEDEDIKEEEDIKKEKDDNKPEDKKEPKDEEEKDDKPEEEPDDSNEETPEEDDDISDEEPDEEDDGLGDIGEEDSEEIDDNLDSGEASNNTEEKRRLYLLSKNYSELYNNLNIIINKIENIEFENDEKDDVKDYVLINLNKVKDILYDYITMTFNTKTYNDNLFTLEKFKNSIKILVKMLKIGDGINK